VGDTGLGIFVRCDADKGKGPSEHVGEDIDLLTGGQRFGTGEDVAVPFVTGMGQRDRADGDDVVGVDAGGGR
jgi:hypothetical protein